LRTVQGPRNGKRQYTHVKVRQNLKSQ